MKKMKHIAVICVDVDDFREWKHLSGYANYMVGTFRKFQVKNTVYHCITRVVDLCSLAVDEIVSTAHAAKNPEYEEIVKVAKINLVSPEPRHELPRPKDSFLESIHMYDRLSKLCDLYRELIKDQDVVIKLLKKSRKSSSELIEYSNASDRIAEIKKKIDKHEL